MTDANPCHHADFIATVEGFTALTQLIRLIAAGQAVDLADLTDEAGPSVAGLQRALRSQPGTEWDDQGRLVGFGLTPRVTSYRLVVGGRTLYTWCASDTLLFTVILGEDTIAESVCPATGVPIRLEISPAGLRSVTPSGAVLSQRLRDDLVGNLRSDICDHGHFFASAAAAGEWLGDHPDGQVLTVAEAFDECRSACEELHWVGARVAGS